MGKGFYLIELEEAKTAQKLLITMNPVDLRGARAFFSPWRQGFNALKATKTGERLFKVTEILPNLDKEYVPLLLIIGHKVGITLKTKDSMATRISKANGMSSIKLQVTGVEFPPSLIKLPALGGDLLLQQ